MRLRTLIAVVMVLELSLVALFAIASSSPDATAAFTWTLAIGNIVVGFPVAGRVAR